MNHATPSLWIIRILSGITILLSLNGMSFAEEDPESALAKKTQIPRKTIQRILKEIGVPEKDTQKKMDSYFATSDHRETPKEKEN